MAAQRSSLFSTRRPRNPLAPSPLIRKRRKRFGPAPENPVPATVCLSAMASTSRRTAATAGPTWACRIPNALRKLSSIRRTAARFTCACPENCGATAKIAASKPNVVYALIESTRSALFRSEDGGKTWEERDRSNWMVWRPFYFANLIVDPKNENKVYKPDLILIMSEDGGKSFSSISNSAHGDFHVVWVNP